VDYNRGVTHKGEYNATSHLETPTRIGYTRQTQSETLEELMMFFLEEPKWNKRGMVLAIRLD
jgi:hypothetical protein